MSQLGLVYPRSPGLQTGMEDVDENDNRNPA